MIGIFVANGLWGIEKNIGSRDNQVGRCIDLKNTFKASGRDRKPRRCKRCGCIKSEPACCRPVKNRNRFRSYRHAGGGDPKWSDTIRLPVPFRFREILRVRHLGRAPSLNGNKSGRPGGRIPSVEAIKPTGYPGGLLRPATFYLNTGRAFCFQSMWVTTLTRADRPVAVSHLTFTFISLSLVELYRVGCKVFIS